MISSYVIFSSKGASDFISKQTMSIKLYECFIYFVSGSYSKRVLIRSFLLFSTFWFFFIIYYYSESEDELYFFLITDSGLLGYCFTLRETIKSSVAWYISSSFSSFKFTPVAIKNHLSWLFSNFFFVKSPWKMHFSISKRFLFLVIWVKIV